VSVTILDREMYTEAAAARLLRVAPSTLHWWLEGRPPRYRPVIRVEPAGSRNITWAEFVAARCRMTPRAAQVRFYVDADIPGPGKILGSLRNDVTYPGDPGAVLHKRHRAPCPIGSPDVLDTDWIPDVAARGWLIVTRDSMILQNRNEIAAIRENNAKTAALNQRDARTKRGQLEVFMTQWRHIEALTAERGPFIWRVSRTAMTSIPLD
jgi:PIN like domain